MIETYLRWIKAHERIIIVALVLGVGYFGLGRILDHNAAVDASNAAVAQQIATVQHEADVKLATVVSLQQAEFDKESKARDAEMARLTAAVSVRDAASAKKVTDVLAAKTPSDVLTNLANAFPQIEFNPTELTSSGKLAFTLPVVQQVTAAKIEGDTAEADLADTKKQLDTTQQLLASAVSDWGTSRQQVAGLQKELATNETASKAEIASLKASARKSKFGWFKIGFVTGFVSGVLAGHYI